MGGTKNSEGTGRYWKVLGWGGVKRTFLKRARMFDTGEYGCATLRHGLGWGGGGVMITFLKLAHMLEATSTDPNTFVKKQLLQKKT